MTLLRPLLITTLVCVHLRLCCIALICYYNIFTVNLHVCSLLFVDHASSLQRSLDMENLSDDILLHCLDFVPIQDVFACRKVGIVVPL